ncbi:MAG: hypothetical protein H7A25_19640 [Leptospiraceae bacterium]|nr:hypothetical protein [Leptospiraceae bacterium]MCP5502120.1 hypothetical protein [Leptospiraceae bacterium]
MTTRRKQRKKNKDSDRRVITFTPWLPEFIPGCEVVIRPMLEWIDSWNEPLPVGTVTDVYWGTDQYCYVVEFRKQMIRFSARDLQRHSRASDWEEKMKNYWIPYCIKNNLYHYERALLDTSSEIELICDHFESVSR